MAWLTSSASMTRRRVECPHYIDELTPTSLYTLHTAPVTLHIVTTLSSAAPISCPPHRYAPPHSSAPPPTTNAVNPTHTLTHIPLHTPYAPGPSPAIHSTTAARAIAMSRPPAVTEPWATSTCHAAPRRRTRATWPTNRGPRAAAPASALATSSSTPATSSHSCHASDADPALLSLPPAL